MRENKPHRVKNQSNFESLQDFLAKLRRSMEANDVVYTGGIAIDGKFHRLPARKDRRNQDVSYICSQYTCKNGNEYFYCWFWNYCRGGEPVLVKSFDESRMNGRTYKEICKDIKKSNENLKAKTCEIQAEAAAKAKKLVEQTGLAADDFPYFVKKRMDNAAGLYHNAFYGNKQAVFIPVYADMENKEIQGGEYILPDGDKRFFKGGKTQGGMLVLGRDRLDSGGEAAPINICEGVSTGEAIYRATGQCTVIAFSAGNLQPVAEKVRAQWPMAAICICADNDIGKDKNGGPLPNTGIEYATKAAKAIGATVAIPEYKGRKVDFNDYVSIPEIAAELGPCAVKKAINGARGQVFVYGPEGFMNRQDGLFRIVARQGGAEAEVLVAPHIEILGRTCDRDSKNWSTLVKFKDQNEVGHTLPVSDESLCNPRNSGIQERLANEGYSIRNGQISNFVDYIQGIKTNVIKTATKTIGWLGHEYVLPGRVFGGNTDKFFLDTTNFCGLFTTKGNLQDWQEMARLCIGNRNLAFALCAGFAAVLLPKTGLHGYFFNFYGNSSTGKTTQNQIGASIWGNPENHVFSWRSTDNALELLASVFNNNLLVLDEISEIESEALKKAIYMLGGGQGKKRLTRDAALRPTHTWKVLGLSSGEKSIGNKLLERGIEEQAGQELRIFDLPVSKNDISSLHGMAGAGELVRTAKRLAHECHGVAGDRWLSYLTAPEGGPCLDGLRKGISEMAEKLAPYGADGQVERAAHCFALLAHAGFWAEKAGILPQASIGRGYGFDNPAASYWFSEVKAAFDIWLDERGGCGSAEEYDLLSAVRNCIEQHGSSRFQWIDEISATVIKRIGFKRMNNGRIEWLLSKEAIEREFHRKAVTVAKTLLAHGWLLPEPTGRLQQKQWLNGRDQRFYVIALPDED